MKKIVIIGGGAAGYFLAANLQKSDHYEVTILEKGKSSLQKVRVSGGGRCNVTHACFDPRELVDNYPRGQKELRSVFSRFQPGDTMAWFEERGVPLKIEEDGRVFPQSNQSESIVQALEGAAIENGTLVTHRRAVTAIERDGNGFRVSTVAEEIKADVLVMASGSSKLVWKILEQMGHHIVRPVPSLFTFQIDDKELTKLSGIGLAQVEIRIPDSQLLELGPLLITHWGLSGPVVLKLSAWGARMLEEKGYRFMIEVNWVNQQTEDVYEQLIEHRVSSGSKSIGMQPLGVPKRLWQYILAKALVNPKANWADLSNTRIMALADTLTRQELQVMGKSTFKDEFVTSGGVDLREVDFRTMQSKLFSNLYFAGEVLNIDAITGGFNFQACWSEAYIIASHLQRFLSEAD